MGPHSAGAHVQDFADSPSGGSLSSSTTSFYSEASELDRSPSTPSTFGDLSVPHTPNDPYRRGSAPEGRGHPPGRPPMMQRRSSHDLFECIEANDRFDENKAKYIFEQVGESAALCLTTCGRERTDAGRASQSIPLLICTATVFATVTSRTRTSSSTIVFR